MQWIGEHGPELAPGWGITATADAEVIKADDDTEEGEEE